MSYFPVAKGIGIMSLPLMCSAIGLRRQRREGNPDFPFRRSETEHALVIKIAWAPFMCESLNEGVTEHFLRLGSPPLSTWLLAGSRHPGSRSSWLTFKGFPLICCMTPGKLLLFSELQYRHLEHLNPPPPAAQIPNLLTLNKKLVLI